MTNITDQLPYELCEGVVATVEGLYLYHPVSAVVSTFKNVILNFGFDVDGEPRVYWTWQDAARHLQYKIDDPGIAFIEDSMASWWQLIPKDTRYYNNAEVIRLHRYAAILCDDAEAFRVLYQCIKEFGG